MCTQGKHENWEWRRAHYSKTNYGPLTRLTKQLQLLTAAWGQRKRKKNLQSIQFPDFSSESSLVALTSSSLSLVCPLNKWYFFQVLSDSHAYIHVKYKKTKRKIPQVHHMAYTRKAKHKAQKISFIGTKL